MDSQFSTGFGTYRISNQNIIEDAIMCGYTHFDTAELYKNEHMVQNAIEKAKNAKNAKNAKDNKDIFITTKISKKSIMSDNIVSSFYERLKIFPYINLLLLHVPSINCRKDWLILCELYKQNRDRVGNIGVSNYDIEHLEEIMDCPIKPYCNQIELSPFYIRTELVKYLRSRDILIVSHTSLTRTEKFDNKVLNEMAAKYNTTVARVLLKWAKEHEYIIIPKSSTIEHMVENKEQALINLTSDDMAILNGLNENFHITKVVV